jgi:hypothetical protein
MTAPRRPDVPPTAKSQERQDKQAATFSHGPWPEVRLLSYFHRRRHSISVMLLSESRRTVSVCAPLNRCKARTLRLLSLNLTLMNLPGAVVCFPAARPSE